MSLFLGPRKDVFIDVQSENRHFFGASVFLFSTVSRGVNPDADFPLKGWRRPFYCASSTFESLKDAFGRVQKVQLLRDAFLQLRAKLLER